MKIKNRSKNIKLFFAPAKLMFGSGYRYRHQFSKSRLGRVSGMIALTLAAVVSSYQLINTEYATAATGNVAGVRISDSSVHKGWVAEIDMEDMTTGGVYDMGFTSDAPGGDVDANAKVEFTVTSPGYDSDGNPTTSTRTVYGTSSLRQPFPNEALPDETAGVGLVTLRVTLSEYIYAGDTVTADIGAGFYTVGGSSNVAATGHSVVNGSTNTHPKPIGRWAWPPYERVKNDFLLEAVVFHRSARDAKPVAAVKFTCTDENTNSITLTVSDMTISSREDSAGTDNEVLVYAATMPISSFTQGDVITCNFVAYPWVGDSSSILSSDLVANGGDGFVQPDERLGPQELLNDKDSTYGEPCAVVSSAGQASSLSTWVYASCALAEAAYAADNTAAYADIGRAAQAIKVYNNVNHGHNDPGGGIIELQAENYSTPGTAPLTTLGAQKTWLTIQPASDVQCKVPVINSNGNNDLMAQKLKYTCLSTSTTAGNTFRGDMAYSDILWLDRMSLNSTELAPIRYWDTVYATRNTINALSRGFEGIYGAARWPSALVRGNYYTALDTTAGFPLLGSLNNVIGNRGVVPRASYAGDPLQISDNSIYAFNEVLNSDNSSSEIWISSDKASSFTHGIAIVQNVIEAASSSRPLVAIENMGGTDSINNLIFWHNTTRGQRSNVAYASDPTNCSNPLPFFINWSWKYNIESNHNHIDEVRNDHGCPADGGRIGNWSMNYSVGGAGNARAVGAGPAWSPPDYLGLYSVGVPTEAGFVSDRSSLEHGGAGGGNGNYHLTTSSTLRNIVPAGQAVLPYDLEGTARYDSGQGAMGGYEFLSTEPAPDTTAPTVDDFSIPATSSSLTITGISLTASDDTDVSGYMLTESATAPDAGDTGWSATAPTEYTFATYGSKTLYAWAKDAAGNVSTSSSATTELTAPEPVAYSIGGTTSGLTGTVVLQNNGADNLDVSTGTFNFDTELPSGADYEVTVLTPPAGQTCTVTEESGVVASADVTDIVVTCADDPIVNTDSVSLSTIPANDNNATSDAVRNGVLSVSSDSCYTFDQSSITTYDTSGVVVLEENVTLLGGVGFRVTCVASGGTANMELVLGMHYADTTKLRIYKQFDSAPDTILTDITDQITFTTQSVAGVDKTVLSYAITDGGLLDDDNAVDGNIVDPIYIGAILTSGQPVTSPANPEQLAPTGGSIFMPIIAGLMTVSLGGMIVLYNSRR